MKEELPHGVPITESMRKVLPESGDAEDGDLVFGYMNKSALRLLLKNKIKPAYLDPTDKRPASVHGMRATFFTWAKKHYGHDLAKMAISHVIGSTADRSYDRDADMLDERRPMTQAWSDFCTGAATGNRN